MKKLEKKALLRAGLTLALALGTMFSLNAEPKKIEATPNVDVYVPEGATGKLPVVFLAHNGGAKKEDWQDYASSLAESGYIVASIGWSDFNNNKDFKDAIAKVLTDYAEQADTERVAFIGGCHGAVKFTQIMSKEPYSKFKALVFLSISEDVFVPKKHAPILAVYSTKDHLGDYYIAKTKEVATRFSKPSKVVVVNGKPHGHEFVTDAESGATIREEIKNWLAANL